MDFVLGSKDISVPFNFSIPDKNKLGNKITRVGVWSSGGLDSTALLCLIISELINTKRLDIIEVVALTVIKGEGSTYYSDRIIQKTMNHFGISITHINNLPNNQPGFSEGRVGIVPVRRIYEENKDNMDILGNLMEWTLDHYDPERYSKLTENEKNPIAEVNSAKYPKSLRGGSFMESGTAFRSAKLFHSEPAWNRRDPQIPKSKWWLTEAKNVGIRLVRPQVAPSVEAVNEFFKNYLGL